MTPRERIQTAVAHQQPDICPYILGFGADLRRRLVDFTGDPAFDAGLEPHLIGVGPAYPETNERVDDHRYTDAFGVIWEEAIRGEIGMVRDPVLKEPSLKGYAFPDPRPPGLFDALPAQLTAHPDRYSSWSLGFSLFERAWTLRGFDTFLLDLVDNPAFADELLERICAFNLERKISNEAIAEALQLASLNASAVWCGFPVEVFGSGVFGQIRSRFFCGIDEGSSTIADTTPPSTR